MRTDVLGRDQEPSRNPCHVLAINMKLSMVTHAVAKEFEIVIKPSFLAPRIYSIQENLKMMNKRIARKVEGQEWVMTPWLSLAHLTEGYAHSEAPPALCVGSIAGTIVSVEWRTRQLRMQS